jgi:hypothetical protein
MFQDPIETRTRQLRAMAGGGNGIKMQIRPTIASLRSFSDAAAPHTSIKIITYTSTGLKTICVHYNTADNVPKVNFFFWFSPRFPADRLPRLLYTSDATGPFHRDSADEIVSEATRSPVVWRAQ